MWKEQQEEEKNTNSKGKRVITIGKRSVAPHEKNNKKNTTPIDTRILRTRSKFYERTYPIFLNPKHTCISLNQFSFMWEVEVGSQSSSCKGVN
jgi:hypothetical protein